MSCEMAFDKICHLAVQWGEDLIQHFDEGHVEAEMDQVLRHFETNESTAYHYRMTCRLHHLDSRIVGHPR